MSDAEENLTNAGQRRVNIMWEFTQAVMTILIVGTNMYVACLPAAVGGNPTLTNAMFVVLGFYYGRTNHQKIGGVIQGR